MQTEEYFRAKGCIVTGAASGIGYALTEGLLAAGATVLMADRDTKTLQEVVGRLQAHAGRVHTLTVDVTIEEQVRTMVEEGAAKLGRLDILFNNAGIGFTKAFEQVTLEEWRRIIDVNVWSVIYGIHYALPIMRRQGGGHIVSTSSISGIVPIPFQSLYCTTKYAVTGLSESLRMEFKEAGIHFSVACPSEVVTAIWKTPGSDERVEDKIPKEAISAGEAAKLILAGAARHEGIIPLPDRAREMWELYRTSPEAAENKVWDLIRKRKEAWEKVQQ
jgi:NAD(P)-dependent dehydrogenase (short-subunit alcohol dehydrogenase family)